MPTQSAYDKYFEMLKPTLPITKMLKEMAGDPSDLSLLSQVICMIGEIEAFERHACTYCKSVGHKRNVCPVYQILRH